MHYFGMGEINRDDLHTQYKLHTNSSPDLTVLVIALMFSKFIKYVENNEVKEKTLN